MERSQKRPLEMSYSQHNKKRNTTTENSKLALGVIGHSTLMNNNGANGIQQLKNNKLTTVAKLPEITDSIERKVRFITISKKNSGNLKPLRSCDPNVIKQKQDQQQQQQQPLKQAPVAINNSINPFTTAQQNKHKLAHSNKLNQNHHDTTIINTSLSLSSSSSSSLTKSTTTKTTTKQAEPIVITIDDEEQQTALDHNHVTKTEEEDDCSTTTELESQPSSQSSSSSNATTIYEEDELALDLETDHEQQQSSQHETIDFSNPDTYYQPPRKLSQNPHISDHDRAQLKEVCSEPHYAWDIFEYYKCKEETCLNVKYLTSSKSCEITAEMRAVLVDWMVEVQESFELNHETLYLAVKIMDQYLMKKSIRKSQFQLLGITCLLIAAKFDERIPPAIDDFVYSCDSAFTKRQVIHFEMDVLKELNFFIGFPLSYRFLRRFARCGDCDFYTLTLARYILEMSLMEYDLVDERESKIAAAALFLAIEMLNLGGWNETLELYTGYSDDDLMPLLFKLNDMISAPMNPRLKTVRTKYEHKVFLEVAKVKPLPSQ